MCVHSSVHCVHDVYSLLRVSKHHRRVAKLGTFYLLSFGTVQLRNKGSFCSIFQDLHSRLRVYHTWFRSETPESPQRNSLLSLLPVWQPSFRTGRKSRSYRLDKLCNRLLFTTNRLLRCVHNCSENKASDVQECRGSRRFIFRV